MKPLRALQWAFPPNAQHARTERKIMYLENLQASEMERIAYMTGDTMAARAFGDFADNEDDIELLSSEVDDALDLVGCSGQRGQHLYASMHELGASGETAKTLACTLQTIASCYQHPAKPTRKQVDALSRVILEIVACPGDYNAESARSAVYVAFGEGLPS